MSVPKKLPRAAISLALYHVEQLAIELDKLHELNTKQGGASLAIAVKALRTIANHTGTDPRAKGLAKGALRRMGVGS